MPDAVYPVDYPGDFPVFPAIGPDCPVSFHSIASGITPLLPITRHGARHDCIGKDQDMKAYPTSTVMIATVWIILISGARNQFRRQVIEVAKKLSIQWPQVGLSGIINGHRTGSICR